MSVARSANAIEILRERGFIQQISDERGLLLGIQDKRLAQHVGFAPVRVAAGVLYRNLDQTTFH